MDEKRMFKTMVKNGTEMGKWKGRPYAIGRIHGFMTIICDGGHSEYASISVNDDERRYVGRVLITKCTEEQYQEFKNVVERNYPGLCDFDIDFDESKLLKKK